MVLELLEQLHLTASQIGPAKELLLQQSKLGTTGEHDDDAVREYLKAHCCYLQSMFKPVVFPTVGCFVDKYAKDKPEQKRLALKIMLTSYVDTWRRVQREMREANANMQKRIKSDPQYQKKINDLNSDKSKQGKLGALTAGKLGMIGYEVVHALVHHSLTDLAGAASLLKVTEAGGITCRGHIHHAHYPRGYKSVVVGSIVDVWRRHAGSHSRERSGASPSHCRPRSADTAGSHQAQFTFPKI